jgi:hypothetical protein
LREHAHSAKPHTAALVYGMFPENHPLIGVAFDRFTVRRS